jgi:Zn-dependent M32 family carboxypeptidase
MGASDDMPPRIAESSGGWTIDTLKEYSDAQRRAEERFQDERDRRYTEVNIEKEKALKIKETADLAALSLARESQTYKEQQNDALRDKNLQDSGVYAKTSDVAAMFNDLAKKLDPFLTYVTAQQGSTNQGEKIWGKGTTLIAAFVGMAGLAYAIWPK